MEEQFTLFYGDIPSQWYPSEFTVQDIRYNCAEQFMMACKAVVFKDIKNLLKIMQTKNPREQKAYGRLVKNFDASIWNPIAKDFVYAGSFAKYTQNQGMLNWLMSTKGTTLVEASPYDTIWGIGLSEYDPMARNRNTWKGTNWLGEVLTELRTDLENRTIKDHSPLLDRYF